MSEWKPMRAAGRRDRAGAALGGGPGGRAEEDGGAPVTPSAIYRAAAYCIRDMPRVFGDWTCDLLTDAEYQRLKDEIAYTIASADDGEVMRDLGLVEERIAKGGDLNDCNRRGTE